MLKYTLLSDGSSDVVLIPILDWLMGQLTDVRFTGEWADLRWLPDPPGTIHDRVRVAMHFYSCDLLMVHRDAEREPMDRRRLEIRNAVRDIEKPPVVCVVPVRMQEAWLLFDKVAIRTAAGKPRSRIPLQMPAISRLEAVANPKEKLHEILRAASGLSGRRLLKFNARRRVHRLSTLISDYSPIRSLPAFEAMERELCDALQELGAMRATSSK